MGIDENGSVGKVSSQQQFKCIVPENPLGRSMHNLVGVWKFWIKVQHAYQSYAPKAAGRPVNNVQQLQVDRLGIKDDSAACGAAIAAYKWAALRAATTTFSLYALC